MSDGKLSLSVLMSTYAGTDYVCEQLDSLRTQTRMPDEVVVIDDCSLDDTVDVVERYIAQHDLGNRWRVVRNEHNKGWQRNFMEGVAQTSGDVVFFSDQDDVWFENKLAVYESVLQKNDGINIVASGETKWNGVAAHGKLLIGNDAFTKPSLVVGAHDWYIRTAGCCMAFRRDYFDRVSSYWVDLWAHDDFLWKMGIVDKSLALLNASSILHRFHGTNISTQKRNLKDTNEGIDLQLRICDALISRVRDRNVPQVDSGALMRVLSHMRQGLRLRQKGIQKKNLLLTAEIMIKYPEVYRRRNEPAGDVLLYMGLMRRDKR